MQDRQEKEGKPNDKSPPNFKADLATPENDLHRLQVGPEMRRKSQYEIAAKRKIDSLLAQSLMKLSAILEASPDADQIDAAKAQILSGIKEVQSRGLIAKALNSLQTSWKGSDPEGELASGVERALKDNQEYTAALTELMAIGLRKDISRLVG